LTDTNIKKCPLLVALMAKIVKEDGLESETCPHQWKNLLEAIGQAKTAAKVLPETIHPVTQKAWLSRCDETMSDTSTPRASGNPQKARPNILGTPIQYCIIICQWTCPICLRRLLTEHDLSSIPNLISAIRRLHFDHFIPALKGDRDGTTYKTAEFWCLQPMVLRITPEKRSGYFVHCD